MDEHPAPISLDNDVALLREEVQTLRELNDFLRKTIAAHEQNATEHGAAFTELHTICGRAQSQARHLINALWANAPDAEYHNVLLAAAMLDDETSTPCDLGDPDVIDD